MPASPMLFSSRSVQMLRRRSFEERGTEGAAFTEDSIQSLIQENPSLLPLSEIDAAFSPEDVIPVCRELPLPCGSLDNLFITPRGHIILAECKLWRNPQARREVVGQIMEYAKEISRMTPETLEGAINKARKDMATLYDIVRQHPEALAEEAFYDTISRRLRMGDFILLVVGDGIREQASELAEFMQQHMHLSFRLAMVSLQFYDMPDGQTLVVPIVPLKTDIIERAVIRLEDAGMAADAPPKATIETHVTPKRRANYSEEEFFQLLSENQPQEAVNWLKGFIQTCQDAGMYPEFKRSLLMKFSPDGETEFTVFSIMPDGSFWTYYAHWRTRQHELEHLTQNFQKELAELFSADLMAYNKVDKEIRRNGRNLDVQELATKAEAVKAALVRYAEEIKEEIRTC